MTEQCPDSRDDVQCQLVAGHEPPVHVAGRAGSQQRMSWLLGRPYDASAPDDELPWAEGFPTP